MISDFNVMKVSNSNPTNESAQPFPNENAKPEI